MQLICKLTSQLQLPTLAWGFFSTSSPELLCKVLLIGGVQDFHRVSKRTGETMHDAS